MSFPRWKQTTQRSDPESWPSASPGKIGVSDYTGRSSAAQAKLDRSVGTRCARGASWAARAVPLKVGDDSRRVPRVPVRGERAVEAEVHPVHVVARPGARRGGRAMSSRDAEEMPGPARSLRTQARGRTSARSGAASGSPRRSAARTATSRGYSRTWPRTPGCCRTASLGNARSEAAAAAAGAGAEGSGRESRARGAAPHLAWDPPEVGFGRVGLIVLRIAAVGRLSRHSTAQAAVVKQLPLSAKAPAYAAARHWVSCGGLRDRHFVKPRGIPCKTAPAEQPADKELRNQVLRLPSSSSGLRALFSESHSFASTY